jgi:hypothetical protein
MRCSRTCPKGNQKRRVEGRNAVNRRCLMRHLGVAAVATWFMLFSQLMTAPAFGWHGAGTRALATDPVTPTTVYAATEPATLLKSVNGGATWSGAALPTTGHLPALAIDPLSPATLHVAGDSRVLKSTDGGATWMVASLIDSVAVLAIDPGHVDDH